MIELGDMPRAHELLLAALALWPPAASAQKKAGDEVEVMLELDTAPREVVVPPELAAALDADPIARTFFDGLSYSNKRVFTLSVEGTSNPETKARRVDKAIAMMREGRVR